MAKLPEEVKDLMKDGHAIWVSTIGEDGTPNISYKGSGALLDDEHIFFADIFSLKTRENLLQNSRVALGIMSSDKSVAVQVKGVADMIEKGELFDQVSAKMKEMSADLPPVRYVVRILVESVYDLSAGPNAGQKIA